MTLSLAGSPMIGNQRAHDNRQPYASPPEPQTVLKDNLTVVDLNFILNLPTPILDI